LIETIRLEIFGEVPMWFGVGLQTLTALFLGGLVGYDREKKSKAAGLKTHMLICLGSSIFTSIGIIVALSYGDEGDPNRIAAQIVSGIGFLGAGAIIRGQEHVMGLTSAATIWLVAAIGYTVGTGFPITATGFTLTVLVVLKLMAPFYKLAERENDYGYFQLEVLSKGRIRRVISAIAIGEGAEIDEINEEDFGDKKGRILTSFFMSAHPRQMERISLEIKNLLKVEKTNYHSMSEQVDRLKKSLTASGANVEES